MRKFFSLFFVLLIGVLLVGSVSAEWQLQDVTGEWDEIGGDGCTGSGAQVGTFYALWNPAFNFSEAEHNAFRLNFNVSSLVASDLGFFEQYFTFWSSTSKSLYVNVTLWDVYGGYAVSEAFVLTSRRDVWGESKIWQLGMFTAGISFPNNCSLTFKQNGTNVITHFDYLDSGLTPVTIARTHLVNATNFYTNELLVVLEVSHYGSGSFNFTLNGDDNGDFSAGWDILGTAKDVVDTATGIMALITGLFSALMFVGSWLLTYGFWLVIGGLICVVFSCITVGSIEPLTDFAAKVWGMLIGISHIFISIGEKIVDFFKWIVLLF